MPQEASQLTHFVFRLQHDCPVAMLSRDLPEVPMRSWAGHSREVLHAKCDAATAQRVADTMRAALPHARITSYPSGVVAIFEAHYPKPESISRQLEEHDALWLQPLQYRAGWEYYDVVSLNDQRLGQLLTKLLSTYPMEVLSRRNVAEKSLLAAFFVPLNPIVEGLTPKQEEALLAAWRQGYYRQPRGTTTRGVAASLGISRSAYEERLRRAENLVVEGVAPTLAAFEEAGPSPKDLRAGGASRQPRRPTE